MSRFAALTIALAATGIARADEAAILKSIHEFFFASDPAQRPAIAAKIESDPAYDRAKVSGWLHKAALQDALPPGRKTIHVALDTGQARDVVLRVPTGYDPTRSWPLIYALHGTGGNGEHIIGMLEHLLGPEIEQFVIAAPTGYQQSVIHSEGPASAEHPAILLAVRKAANIDSNRVYVTGYSLGGHASWTLAVQFADQFAGAMPLAGTFILPDGDALWPAFLSNVSALPVLCIWGAQDTGGPGGEASPDGGIAGSNHKLQKALVAANCSEAKMIELAGVGHGGVVPPPDALHELLSRKRVAFPPKVKHAFRQVYQAGAYWIEGNVWTGPQWNNEQMKLELKPGEDPRDALHREIRARLGEISGEISGQSITVSRKHISDLTIWFGDGMIDWSKPVSVKLSGKQVFDGVLKPDLGVCLAQAARTWDFDRLRWAGLRYGPSGKAYVVTPAVAFPEVGVAASEPKPERKPQKPK